VADAVLVERLAVVALGEERADQRPVRGLAQRIGRDRDHRRPDRLAVALLACQSPAQHLERVQAGLAEAVALDSHPLAVPVREDVVRQVIGQDLVRRGAIEQLGGRRPGADHIDVDIVGQPQLLAADDEAPAMDSAEPPQHRAETSAGVIGGGVVGCTVAWRIRQALGFEVDLYDRGEQSIEFERLEELALEVLGEVEGAESTRRLRRLRELQELDLPIILLVGGATGTGKSTVATEAAYRLGITRVTSTDFVRQTMRAFFSAEFMPSIHYSSFEAADGLREPEQAEVPAAS